MNTAPGLRLRQLADVGRTCVRHASSGRKSRRGAEPRGFDGPEGHGEKIWVFAHRRSEQVIYSLRKQLDGFHDLKQLPFNGKKTKPAKLRKDYWSPMAVIELPVGRGSVGRSIFQKLRELKHRHEVAWEDEFLYKTPNEYTKEEKKAAAAAEAKGEVFRVTRTKEQRGVALNAQKKNSIADMAVILAGHGRGNELVTSTGEAEGEDSTNKTLMDVTVRWSNDTDKEYAEEWSSNVKHRLFDQPVYRSGVAELEAGVLDDAAQGGAQLQANPQ